MRVGSLFSGVGGLDLGLHRSGMCHVFFAEQDAYRRRVLARHWPGVRIYDDVRVVAREHRRDGLSLDGGGVGADGGTAEGGTVLDLLAGGPPCQDFSVAGNRAGITGERGHLFFEFLRVADDLVRNGGWVLIENVPGLLSSAGGRDFGAILGALANIGFRDLAYRVLDSRFFGVPQRRRRVFIVARRADGQSASEVLLEPEGSPGDFEAGGEPWARTSASFGGSVANALDRQSGEPDGAVSKCLTASERWDAETETFVTAFAQNQRDEVRDLGGVAGALAAEPGMNQQTYLAQVTAFNATQDPISGPIAGALSDQGAAVSGVGAVRRLTPTETERLQGWPDGWTLAEGPSLADARSWYELEHPDLSPVDPKPDGPRYAACGDGVTATVSEWLGKRIMGWEERNG